MSPFVATELLLLVASFAQTDAQVPGPPGPPGPPGTPGTLLRSHGPPGSEGLPGTKTSCPPVSSDLVGKISQSEPGEPACLGSIPCEIPKIPPFTQACFKVSYKGGKCVLTRDRLQAFHFDNNGVALLYQPGFVSGQYRDSYFCAWNLPDPKPQNIYGIYLLEKDFHGASGGLDQCHCYDHMTVQSHQDVPTRLCGGDTHPQNDKWCKLGASQCLYPGGIKYQAEQTNITFRSDSQGAGSGFFMLVFQSGLVSSCPTCRTASKNLPTLPRVSVPKLPGCSTQLGLTGLDGLQGPSGRNRRATSNCKCTGTCQVGFKTDGSVPIAFQRTLAIYMKRVLNDWDGEVSWAFVNSPTKILSVVAHSRLEELGLL